MLRYKACFHVERMEPDKVFLFSEKERHQLTGEIYYSLFPFLKSGRYTADEIVSFFKEEPEKIYYALSRLENGGYIESNSTLLPDEFLAFCHLLNLDPISTSEKLSSSKIFIQDLTGQDHVFNSLNIQIAERSEDADLTVVLVNDYLDPALKIRHLEQSRIQKPWLLVKPIGLEIWVGPLFRPGEVGCWECLKSRLEMNRIEESYIGKKIGSQAPFVTSRASLEITKKLALNLAALEIVKWVLGINTQIQESILSLNLISMQTHHHTLVPQNHCPSCSTTPKNSPEPLQLVSRMKEGIDDGGYRCISPEATLKKHGHHISHILGIVDSLTPIPRRADSQIYVYNGGHNFALTDIMGGVTYRGGFRSSSSGKGKTESQAKASCLCESIERYAGVFQGYEPRRKAAYKDLEAEAIHPRNLFLVSEKQQKNQVCSEFFNNSYIPRRFDESLEIDWSPVWSLTQRTFKYVPTSFCYYGYPVTYETDFCRASSNGVATGNCMEEAILQGFFELVERDCVAIWWYNCIQRPSVNLSTFNDPYFRALTQEYLLMDREIWVIDITNDLNIPTFAAVSRKRKGPEAILFGFGTHFDPKIAISRALSEMNQFLCNLDAKKPSQNPENPLECVIANWLAQATLKNQPYLCPTHIERCANDYPTVRTKDFLEDIENCRKIVEKEGMELLVLDQSRPDVDLKVAKVIVPGLRHFYPFFGPGRLYDVPVTLSWLTKPKEESELNPIPMFL